MKVFCLVDRQPVQRTMKNKFSIYPNREIIDHLFIDHIDIWELYT